MNLEVDFVFRHEAAVCSLAELPNFLQDKVRAHEVLGLIKSGKDLYKVGQLLGLDGRFAGIKTIKGEKYIVIEGDPANRMFKESQVKLKDPRLVQLKLDKFALSPTGALASDAAQGVRFNFYFYTAYNAGRLLNELVQSGDMLEFFRNRGVDFSVNLFKDLVAGGVGTTWGGAAAAFGASVAGSFAVFVSVSLVAGAILNYIDDEFGYTQGIKQKIQDMIDDHQAGRIRPGNVIKLQ